MKIRKAFVAVRNAVVFSPLAVRLVTSVIARRGRICTRGVVIDVANPLVTPWVKIMLFWGMYERDEVSFVRRYLPSASVIELGGSIGVVASQIINKIGAGRQMITVEADPRLIELLSRNIARNARGAEFKVIHAAIDYSGDPVARLHLGGSNLSSEVVQEGAEGSVIVPTATLSDLVTRNRLGRYVLVADIEGAEIAILRKDSAALKDCDMMIIELHRTTVDGEVVQVDRIAAECAALGFTQVARRHDVFVFAR